MAQRKLQQEIDRVFKRISEGVTAFDALYDKLMSTTNQSQKEKLEQDLKREIKKLQRLRDQIKTWMGSNDIKDKKALSDQRKLIETQMERFKACEKEMKTKAYSKEGLTASAKLDPKEKEKQEMANFVQGMIEELDRQVESAEAQVESIRATMKKGKKDSSKTEKISEIESNIERHKWHQSRLELILRMLENGNIQPEQVQNIQDDIRYYVESNQDADFAEDDEIYDELNLDNDEDIFGMTADGDHVPHHEDDEDEEGLSTPPATAAAPPPAAQAPTPPATATATATAPAAKKETSRKPSTSTSAPSKSPVANHSQITSIPGISNPSMKPASLPTRPAGDMKYVAAASSSTGNAASSTTPATTTTTTSTSSTQQQPQQMAPGIAPLPPAQQRNHVAESRSKIKPPGPPSQQQQQQQQQPAPQQQSPTSSSTEKKEASDNEEMKGTTPELNPSETTTTTNTTTTTTTTSSSIHLPPGLRDLISSFEAAKKRIDDPPPIESIGDLLNSSLMHCPDSFDADKPKHYQPSNPYPTPAYYPQEPLPIFDDPALYEKLDLDTLFYVFYYRQGTYQQYLTARELKRQSWRYHKRFLTWFQRHEEPKSITDEYEQGTYRYFDFEGLWLQRRKTNFQFEYQYLEDEV